MASAPAFASTPKIWAAAVSTANTNRDGTGTIATIGTAGASGTKIERIVVKATADPADGVVILWLHDGTNFWMLDEVDTGDPAAGSTTVAAYREERVYGDLVLPSGWSLRAQNTVALTVGVFHVTAYGADL
jgi:hypothetical protein